MKDFEVPGVIVADKLPNAGRKSLQLRDRAVVELKGYRRFDRGVHELGKNECAGAAMRKNDSVF